MTQIAFLDTTALQGGGDAVDVWLRALYTKYSSSLYRYALALTCSVEDAQDAVQEVFARVARQRKRFLQVQNVQAYLFTATRNAAYSALRGRQRSRAFHDTICADLAAICAPPDRQMSATIIAIREALAELTVEQREVLVLKILHQLTFREIADMVHAPLSTVAGRYRYGTERLRHSLGITDGVWQDRPDPR